jgi:hypothetical protein
MLSLDDIDVIESGESATEIEYYSAIQRAINSGSAWSFQGSYGREMMAAIESGRCLLGREGARDYWGNYIPSRDQVKAGTKGSRSYVRQAMGESWARKIAAVK